MPFIEVYKESRKLERTNEAISESFVFAVWDDGTGTGGDGFDPAIEDDDPNFDPNDDNQALDYVERKIPDSRLITSGGLVYILLRQKISIENRTDTIFTARVEYSTDELPSNQCKISYTTKGNTETITQSLEVMSSARSDGIDFNPPDNKGAIGITENAIEGASVETKGLEFSITFYLDSSVAHSFSYVNTLYNLSKSMNDAPIFGFAIGEVLFRGANSSGSLGEKVPVTLDFRGIPNDNGTIVEGFEDFPLFKLGHDLLDYVYDKEWFPNEQDTIRTPKFRYVHRVYPLKDLTALQMPC